MPTDSPIAAWTGLKERIIKGETQILVLFGEIVTIATITNDHKLNVSFEQWIYHTNAMQLGGQKFILNIQWLMKKIMVSKVVVSRVTLKLKAMRNGASNEKKEGES